MDVEQAARDVEQLEELCVRHAVDGRRPAPLGRQDVPGAEDRQLLRHRRTRSARGLLDLSNAQGTRSRELEDPDAQWMREGLEELSLESAKALGIVALTVSCHD